MRPTPFDSADVLIAAQYGIGPGQQVTVSDSEWRPGQTANVTTPGGAPIATVTTNGSLQPTQTTRTEYRRWLTIIAVDGKTLRSSRELHALWQGEAVSTGSSADLRTILNFMLLPATNLFGVDTKRTLQFTYHERDLR